MADTNLFDDGGKTRTFANNYTILQKIGEGGMGVVYKALERNPQRTVAIKFISTGKNPDVVKKRFLREAQLSAQLDHANIVKIYNVGRVENYIYIVMEYIAGKPLDVCLKEQTLSLHQKIVILEKVARALHYAHGHKIIHRDIKPANIIITPEQQPIIMDFGLAKNIRVQDNKLTKTGEIVGTPRYMSLEQMAGHRSQIDARTDVHALGAILYEMVTGTYMVPGESAVEVFFNLQNSKITAMSKQDPSAPKDLENIWLKSTQTLQYRYANAELFADDLHKFLNQQKVSGGWLGFHYRFGKILYTALFVMMCALLSGLYLHFNVQQKIEIDESTPAVRAQRYINQELYTKAQQILQQIIASETKPSHALYENLLFVCAKLKQYQKVQKIYKNHIQSDLIKNKTILTLMAMYYEQRNAYQIKKIAQQYPKESDIQEKNNYYIAMLYYKKQDYTNALLYFKKIPNIIENSDRELLSYVAQCQYETVEKPQKNFAEALQILQKLESIAPQDNIALSYMGKYHLEMFAKNDRMRSHHLQKANEYFQRCVKANPHRSEYYTFLGKTFLYQKEYKKAYQAFVNAIEKGDNSVATIELLMEVSFQKPSLQDNSIIFLKYISAQSSRVTAPDLFREKFAAIEHTYRDVYITKKKALNTDGKLQTFFDLIRKITDKKIPEKKFYDSAIVGIIRLRYQKNWQKNTQNFAMTLPEKARKKMLDTLRSIEQKRKHEERLSLYYEIAHLYLNTNAQIKKDLNPHLLQQVFKDTNESILKRYLAAKALVQILDFATVESLTTQASQDLVGAIISVCVLREAGIREDMKVFQEMNRLNPQQQGHEFLLALIAKSTFIYPKHRLRNRRPPEWRFENRLASDILYELIDSHYPIVKLYAAASTAAINSRYPKKLIMSLKILTSNMQYSQPIVHRAYAHYYFWISPQVFRNPKQFIREYRIGLNDPSEYIKSIPLFYLDNYNQVKIDRFADDLKRLIQKPGNIGLRAIYGYSNQNQSYQTIQRVIYNTELSPFVRIYTYMAANFMRLFSANSVQKNILRYQQILREFPQLLNDPNVLLRQWVCISFATLGYYRLDLIENQSTELQNSILVYLRRPFVRFDSLEKMQPFMRTFIKRIITVTEVSEKQAFVEKKLKSPNPTLRKNAMAAKVVLATKEQKQQIYQQMLRETDTAKVMGAAIGFHSTLRFHLWQEVIIKQMNLHQNTEENYGGYIVFLRQVPASQQQQFLQWLSHAIKLARIRRGIHPSLSEKDMAQFYYERAVVYRSLGRYEESIKDLLQATRYYNYSRYWVELAEIYLWQNKNDAVRDTLESLDTLQTQRLMSRMANLYAQIGDNDKAYRIFKYLFLHYSKDLYGVPLASLRLKQTQNNKDPLAKKYLAYALEQNMITAYSYQERKEVRRITGNFLRRSYPDIIPLLTPQKIEQIRIIEKYDRFGN
ncbi:serine/threonine-protein kinase [Candidatus Uabimicrobium amorphum]|uniref:Protein kinase n=1 Tax=Uabimicrobium amorphum TaxID=2596890 RepID=A0A5S9F4G0_UABAM|nr:serine/threonine-protein kinase [Candidatus Uabimicrobium amorphum]BBM85746.1 protein kinase [Candidatus Uabimicrobium amorphum]